MRSIQRNKKYTLSIFSLVLFILSATAMLCGCSSSLENAKKIDKSDMPLRDNTPCVLEVSAPGTATLTCDDAIIDYSNASKGYIVVNYTGKSSRVKFIVTLPDSSTCTYSLHGGQEIFPLTGGDGTYSVNVFENVEDDLFVSMLTDSFPVELENEFLPYLYPNQYVDFSSDSQVVQLAQQLSEGSHDEIDVVSSVYTYLKENMAYDSEHAKSIANGETGYIPSVDDVLASGKGICFDYASVMTAMLRSQKIPTRLEIGLTGNGITHAWISVYTKDNGWVDSIIEFTENQWTLVDPTMASTMNSKQFEKYIGNGSNYLVKYTY